MTINMNISISKTEITAFRRKELIRSKTTLDNGIPEQVKNFLLLRLKYELREIKDVKVK
jgi:hypothetical protein